MKYRYEFKDQALDRLSRNAALIYANRRAATVTEAVRLAAEMEIHSAEWLVKAFDEEPVDNNA